MRGKQTVEPIARNCRLRKRFQTSSTSFTIVRQQPSGITYTTTAPDQTEMVARAPPERATWRCLLLVGLDVVLLHVLQQLLGHLC
jgi:hypothetical protein